MSQLSNPDPYRGHILGIVTMAVTVVPLIVVATAMVAPEPPVHPWAAEAEALGVHPSTLDRGSATYARTCIACHGADGQGVQRLGKPLRNSEFVQTHSDEELFALIVDGRPPTDPANTTGLDMPKRGAQALADYQIGPVVTFLRTMQDPDAPFASMEPWATSFVTPVVEEPVVAQAVQSQPPAKSATAAKESATSKAAKNTVKKTALQPAAAKSAASTTPTPAKKEPTPAAAAPAASAAERNLYVSFCSSCHGPDGGGLPNLGKALAGSEFVKSKTDKELMTFIKTGRPIWDAENTTGIDMPPKGGNPALTDDQIGQIIAFMRTIQS